MQSNRDQILDQFTQQAVPFSTAPGIRDRTALQLLVDSSGVTPGARVLDVACGPGLVLRAFSGVAAHVTGIDVTPAMIARAQELLVGTTNVSLDIGDVSRLPYADQSFDVVVSRFAFHHFPDPGAVLGEMRRVCRSGGRVVVCDLLGSEDPAKAAAFHALEMVRDPSHVRSLRLEELEDCFRAHELVPERAAMYLLPFEVEGLVARSFPADGDRAALRAVYLAAVSDDAIGLHLQRVGDEVHGTYDVAILRAVRD